MSLSVWCLANWRLPMATTWLVSRKRVNKTPVGYHPMLVDVLGHHGQLREGGEYVGGTGFGADCHLLSSQLPAHSPPRVLSRPYHTSHQHTPNWQTVPAKVKDVQRLWRRSGPGTPQNPIYNEHIAGGGDFSSGTLLKGSTETRPGHRESSASSARISRALPPVVVNRENGNWQEVLHF